MYEVFYGGSNKVHPEGFMMSRPKGAGHYVILLIRSGGEYNIDGNIQMQSGVSSGPLLRLDQGPPLDVCHRGPDLEDPEGLTGQKRHRSLIEYGFTTGKYPRRVDTYFFYFIMRPTLRFFLLLSPEMKV